MGRDIRRPEEAVAIEVLLGRRWLEREPEGGYGAARSRFEFL